jgi:hypothetical protein
MKKLIMAAIALGGVIYVASKLKDNMQRMNDERQAQLQRV